MRCLDRQKQWILVSRFEETVAVEDEQGRLTGKHEVKRSQKVPLLASVSAVSGNAYGSIFGQNLSYDRIVTIDDPKYDISESAVLWIETDVEQALRDGGYFDLFSLYESGEDFEGGDFDDYESGDVVDDGEFGSHYPEWTDEPYDYTVKRVGRTSNYTVVAIKHVEVSK